MTKKTRESKIEKYLINQIIASGGLTYKFKSVERGVPDRLVAYDGCIYLIELKMPGEKPRKSQIAVQNKFKQQDIAIYNIDTLQGVDDFIKNILKTKPKQNKKENLTILDKTQFKLSNKE